MQHNIENEQRDRMIENEKRDHEAALERKEMQHNIENEQRDCEEALERRRISIRQRKNGDVKQIHYQQDAVNDDAAVGGANVDGDDATERDSAF